jgi:hypothetical protein
MKTPLGSTKTSLPLDINRHGMSVSWVKLGWCVEVGTIGRPLTRTHEPGTWSFAKVLLCLRMAPTAP